MRENHRLLRKIRKTKVIITQLSIATCFKLEWENRDINVVKGANISKFSKLNDIVTPIIILWSCVFNDVLVDTIVGYTKLYSHREKADISSEITDEKIRLFLSNRCKERETSILLC